MLVLDGVCRPRQHVVAAIVWRLTHLEWLRGDAVILKFLRLPSWPGRKVFAGALGSLSKGTLERLSALATAMGLWALQDAKDVIVDLDSSVLISFGEHEGAVCGYCGKGRNRRRHHPLVASVAGPRTVVHADYRDGTTIKEGETITFLTGTLRRIRCHLREATVLLRADSGFLSRAAGEWLLANNLPFVFAMPLHAGLKLLILNTSFRALEGGVGARDAAARRSQGLLIRNRNDTFMYHFVHVAKGAAVRNVLGQIVRNKDYFPRPALEHEVWDRVERDSVLLLAPRRVGKSSLLLRLRDERREPWRAVYVDVQAAEDEAELVARLILELHRCDAGLVRGLRRLGDWGARTLGRLQGLSVGPLGMELRDKEGPGWRSAGREALGEIARDGNPTLILIDELPIFLQRLLSVRTSEADDDGLRRTRSFLDWFRGSRMALAADGSPVRFLLAGSIGLDGFARAVQMSGAINDLVPLRLGPLDEDESHELLRQLAEGEGLPLDADCRAEMVGLVDWRIPFHLQLLFNQVRRSAKGGRASPAVVRQAWDLLLNLENRKHFSHWEERLDNPLWDRPTRLMVDAILVAAAQNAEGIAESTIQQLRLRHAKHVDPLPVLDTLEHDAYLTRSSGRWRFASTLLRAWWQRYKVSGGRGA